MRLCLIPLKTTPRQPHGNLERLRIRLEEASRFRPDLVCLPECTLTGYLCETVDFARFAEPVNGPTTIAMAELARQFHTHLCFGFLESSPEGVYNSAVFLDRNGSVLHLHRKTSEKPPFLNGQTIESFDTGLGRLALLICGDLFQSGLEEKMGRDTKLALMPMSRSFDRLSPNPQRWESEERQVYLDAVREVGIPVAIVNALDDALEDVAFGGALLVNRQGELLAESPHGSDEILLWEFVE